MSEKLLTEPQVKDVIEFAEGLYFGEKYGYYSPWLSNSLLQGLNGNTKIPTTEAIKKALTDYKNNPETLRDYMNFMEGFDMIFERTLYSYANALSFDLEVICTNAFTNDDYNTKEYIEDKRRVNDFLDKFDYKAEFRRVVMNVLRSETYFTWFRKTKWKNQGMKYALQVMPQDYCMLTGYWEKGMLYDFNMQYFLLPGVDIDAFDPVFKKYFNNIFDGKSVLDYRPTTPLKDRDGTYALWTQTSPDMGAWAFKQNFSTFDSRPFLAPFLKDAIKNTEVGDLQYNKDIASAYAILAGELRMFDNAKSGTQANQFVIDPKQVGAFLQKAKAGLGNVFKVAAMPVENSKFYQYTDNNTTMYTDQLATSAGVGSGISRVIYSSDRQSNAEIEAGLNEMYVTMAAMYPQFENFLEFFINKQTKKYKFRFKFNGSNYPYERKIRFDNMMKIADKGLVLPPCSWASVLGYRPQDFERLLLESKSSGWSENWQVLLNVNTSKSGESGRPEIEGSVNDSTEASRDE